MKYLKLIAIGFALTLSCNHFNQIWKEKQNYSSRSMLTALRALRDAKEVFTPTGKAVQELSRWLSSLCSQRGSFGFYQNAQGGIPCKSFYFPLVILVSDHYMGKVSIHRPWSTVILTLARFARAATLETCPVQMPRMRKDVGAVQTLIWVHIEVLASGMGTGIFVLKKML